MEAIMETVEYGQYGQCCRITNSDAEIYVTRDFGPRIICYKSVGGPNALGELGPDAMSFKTELGTWRPYGGHRLWHAPEASPRSYCPDNDPVLADELDELTVRFTQMEEQVTGIQKELVISMDDAGTGVTVVHTLTNNGIWPVELAPWALTIMAGGGTVIIPQEPWADHTESLDPARPLVLWHYTDLGDPRISFGRGYIRLKCDPAINKAFKLGVGNRQSWAGYANNNQLFIKMTVYDEEAKYPDFGCNFETFTKGNFVELESVAPLEILQPGDSATYIEDWALFKDFSLPKSDKALEEAIEPLVESLFGEEHDDLCDCELCR